MNWNLTHDQKVLVKLIAKLRMAMISNEEFAVNITNAGFTRDSMDDASRRAAEKALDGDGRAGQ